MVYILFKNVIIYSAGALLTILAKCMHEFDPFKQQVKLSSVNRYMDELQH